LRAGCATEDRVTGGLFTSILLILILMLLRVIYDWVVTRRRPQA
jgi:Cu/Ag efflux pump CusA